MPAKNKKRTKKKLKRSYGQEKKNLLPIWQEYVIENHLSIAKNREGLYYQELSLFSCGQEKRRRKNDMQNYSCQYPYVTSLCWSFPKASRNTKNAIAKHQIWIPSFNHSFTRIIIRIIFTKKWIRNLKITGAVYQLSLMGLEFKLVWQPSKQRTKTISCTQCKLW